MYQQSEDRSVFVTGFIRDSKSKPGTQYVQTAVLSLKELAEMVGSDYVEISVFDSKKDPVKQKLITVRQADPKYFKSLKQFQKNAPVLQTPSRGPGPSGPYGQAQNPDEFVP